MVPPVDVAGIDWMAGPVFDVDRAALTGDLADMMARSLQRAAVDGVDGWIDHDLAFTKPWGFDVAAIAVPVAVWQGRHDRMVPFDHGQWLVDHIPTARSRLLDDVGHISLLTHRLRDIPGDVAELARTDRT